MVATCAVTSVVGLSGQVPCFLDSPRQIDLMHALIPNPLKFSGRRNDQHTHAGLLYAKVT